MMRAGETKNKIMATAAAAGWGMRQAKQWLGATPGRRSWAAGISGGVLLLVLVGWLLSGGEGGTATAETTAGDRTSDAAKGGKSSQTGEWYTVQTKSFEVTVSASGELEPKNKVEIKNKVDGRTTVAEVVEEGKAVKEGDVLAKLADDQLKDKIQQESLQTEQARAEKVSAEEGLEIQKNEANSEIKDAERQLEIAKLDLAKWEQGTDPQKQRELKLDLEKAKRTLTRAQRDVELSKQLYEEKFISLNELEDDQIKLIEAENELATAELDIQVYSDFTRPKEVREATSKVEEAEAELQRTTAKNRSELSRKETDVSSKRTALQIREKKLADMLQQLEYTVVKAPKDGLVVYGTSVGRYWERGDPLSQGKEVSFNQLLFVLPDTREMVAVLRVHESMLPKVLEGQKARIKIDARQGKMVEGKVMLISVMAEAGGWWNPDVREYAVRVELPTGFDDTLKPAMRCSGEILVEQVENAIAVPVQAIFAEGSERYCYVRQGSLVRRQMVKAGRSSDQFVEVLEGLQEGDRVLLRQPKAGEVAG
ncbi:MAG: efflux RND transporter periplasmic adaptor subunit [Phycisphaeraceae bacterium]|nr:efflux RND transporter periplasmic adaptor subunit [Phycisphaeraceae bacterium]